MSRIEEDDDLVREINATLQCVPEEAIAMTLGVRLEMDFDAFFDRKDAFNQLHAWREDVAQKVLGLPSAANLQLQRVKRGSLDLEFVVEVGSGISDAELQERLQREAGRLRQLFQRPVLEVRVSGDSGSPTGPDAYGSEFLEDWPDPRSSASDSPSPRRERASSASALARQRALDRLNHPTIASGPRFLMDDSYWQLRRGNRIVERREEEERHRKQHEEEVPPFRATPVPAAVLTPRFEAIQAASAPSRQNRSRSAEGTRRVRHDSPRVRQTPEEQKPPFRARPVPWRVSTPLYDQMVAEERDSRRQRQSRRSLTLLHSASLPPRLEAELANARSNAMEDFYQASPAQSRHGVHFGFAPTRRTSAGQEGNHRISGSGPPTWTAGLRGPPTPLTPAKKRQIDPVETRKVPSYPTTEVPDFATLHEREKQKLERKKYLNRYVTQPEPFVFASVQRRSQVRQPPFPKDPTKDWRWRRPTSAPAGQRSPSGVFSIRALERPSAVVPPRSTEKVVNYQQATQRRLQERREQELREKQQLEQAHEVSPEMRWRVQQAVGAIEPLEEKIDRMVMAKRQGFQRIIKEKKQDLKQIQENVKQRPLLMQHADNFVRARRRALFRVRATLEAAGMRDIESYFKDEELDEFDRVAAREEPVSGQRER